MLKPTSFSSSSAFNNFNRISTGVGDIRKAKETKIYRNPKAATINRSCSMADNIHILREKLHDALPSGKPEHINVTSNAPRK